MPRMPQATTPSQAHTDPEEIILGVDTHKDLHVAAVINREYLFVGTVDLASIRIWLRQDTA